MDEMTSLFSGKTKKKQIFQIISCYFFTHQTLTVFYILILSVPNFR